MTMFFRLFVFVVLGLCIRSESRRLEGYKYSVSSFSQLIRTDNNGASEEYRHRRLHRTTLWIFWKNNDSFIGKCQNVPGFNNFTIPESLFEVTLNNGIINELKVSSAISQWDIEFIRATIGPFQVSAKALEPGNREFRVMEETITGNCSTLYRKTSDARGAGKRIKVVKTKDYSNCTKLPVFHTGIHGKHNLDSLLQDSDVISRKTVTELILKEDNRSYVIDSAIVQNEVALDLSDYSLKANTSLDVKFEGSLKQEVPDSYAENLVSSEGLSYQADTQRYYCWKNVESDSQCDRFVKFHRYQHRQNRKEIVKDLSILIASQLENANDIPINNVLNRFIDLVGLVRYMEYESLVESYRLMWNENFESRFVFKRAVYMAGTLNAVKMIARFFEWGYVELDDKDSMLELPNRCDILSIEYMNEFLKITMFPYYDWSKDHRIRRNTLIVLSNLIRRYYTEKVQSDMSSLKCSYSDISKQEKNQEANQVLPYEAEVKKHWSSLVKKFNNVTRHRQKDFQFYLQALGNTGNALILEEFINESYHGLNDYQKVLFINAMDSVIDIDPKCAQKLFLRLWADGMKTEGHSVVLLAILGQLLKTDLDVGLVFKILNDGRLSWQQLLRYGVKKSVLSEAFDYRQNEQIHKITTGISDRECNENTFCPINHRFDYENEDNYFTVSFEGIRGFDDVPSYASIDVKEKQRGYENRLKMRGIANFIKECLNGEISNIATAGNIALHNGWNQYFYPFENLTLANIPEWFMDQFNTRWYDPEDRYIDKSSLSLDSASIDFPMENGYVFRYSYNEVKYFYLHSKPAMSVDAKKRSVHFVRSKLQQMNAGIANPFDGVQYLYGNDICVHVNLPFKYEWSNKNQIEMKPMFHNEPQRIIHYRNQPYFTERSLNPIIPAAEEETYEKYNTAQTKEDQSNSYEFDRFRFEMHGDNGDIFSVLKEIFLWDLNFDRPFKNHPSTYSLFNLWFHDDSNATTNMIVSFHPLKAEQHPLIIDHSDYGNIKGPFLFHDSDIFHMDVTFTSKTNGYVSVTLVELMDTVPSHGTKYLTKISYKENVKTKAQINISAVHRLIKVDGRITKVMGFADVKYQTFRNNSFYVSCEVDSSFWETKERYLNLTMDFQSKGLSDSFAYTLCLLRGEYKSTVYSNYVMNVILKNEERCDRNGIFIEESVAILVTN